MKRSIPLLGLLAFATPAFADDDFCADLPGLATGTCTMPKGVLQLETEPFLWANSRTATSRDDELDLASSELRYGVADGIEIQASWTPYVHLRSRDGGDISTANGVGDATIGAKFRLTPSDAKVVFGLYPLIKLPVARAPIGNGKVEASLLAPVDIALSKATTLTLMPEADWLADADGHGHHPGETFAAALNQALTKEVAIEGDLSALRDEDPSGTTHSEAAELALIYQRGKTQLDVAVDRRLGGDFPAWRLSTGIAQRF
ncbi:transporter [Sphingomonas sp. ASV193]|uniref:transporter n=1 Tax=Sphingomonas sp. ASV193 TaxID=3144405 RepID=UPI0032E89075